MNTSRKSRRCFYDPKIAILELIDGSFATANDRIKLIKTLTIAKSAIRHNMAKDLPKIKCTNLYLGKNDKATPPKLQKNFINPMPNSSLY